MLGINMFKYDSLTFPCIRLHRSSELLSLARLFQRDIRKIIHALQLIGPRGDFPQGWLMERAVGLATGVSDLVIQDSQLAVQKPELAIQDFKMPVFVTVHLPF